MKNVCLEALWVHLPSICYVGECLSIYKKLNYMENNIGGAKALIISYQALFGAEHLCVFHTSPSSMYVVRIVARTQFDEKIDFALLLEKRWIFFE